MPLCLPRHGRDGGNAIDHEVYLASEGNKYKKTRSFTLKGDLVPDKWEKNNAENELQDMRYRVESAAYSNIIFDKYRNVYYRIYRYGGQLKDKNNILQAMKEYAQRPAAIIITDNNLSKIGEIVLPKGKFNVRNFLILPDGLYLSNAHPANEDLSEDALSFTRLELISLE